MKQSDSLIIGGQLDIMNIKAAKAKEKQTKSAIFYARTYRHLKPNYKMITLYYLLCALPCLSIYLFMYSKITYVISKWVVNILSIFVSGVELGISSGEFLPYFGGVYFVTAPSKMPSFTLILVNLILILLFLLICYNLKDSAKPIAIYCTIGLLIHLISCIFFLFMREYFPYTLSQYSELCMKQQVGIWLSFLAIACLVSGSISHSGASKFIMLFAVVGYSFIFGCLRYVVFLVLLLKASSLYMPTLFFSFGPFFDFLYLVCIYSIYMNKLTLKFDDKNRGSEWHWA